MRRWEPWGQKEEQQDTASSVPRREHNWEGSKEKPLNTGLYSQSRWGLGQALVVGTSVPVALPAGGGGSVFDGGRAATRGGGATTFAPSIASSEN